MLKQRPVICITLGYIIGIIMGLYCKISIVFLYLILIFMYVIFKKEKIYKFKLISFRRYFRYFKIIFTSKVIKIIVISSIVSNTITLFQNNKYENLYKNLENQEISVIAKVISNKKEKENKDIYKLKIENINGKTKYKNTYIYLTIKKDINLEYGDKITLKGKFIEPSTKRNYKGFDYKEYLKTLKVYGTVNLINIKSIEKTNNSIFKISNNIFLKIKDIVCNNFKEQNANVLLGLTIGYTDNIEEEIKDNFANSNISHILAISGMHVAYITICIKYILDKSIGKRKSKIGTALILLVYMFITGFSSSVVRAGIMGIISVMAGVFYRKNDTWNNLCLSLLILLIYNPFFIESISVLLSFAGTIGILVLQKNVKSITLAATLFIIPIIAISFNTISITSLIISVIVGWIIGPIIILGFIFIVLWRFLELLNLKFIYVKILEIMLEILKSIAFIGSKMTLNKIYVTTPNIFEIIIFYSLILIRKFFIFCISGEKYNSILSKN